MSKKWAPAENQIIKDDQMRRQVLTEGAIKTSNIGQDAIAKLKAAFEHYHDFNEHGMFYSLYSKDSRYRTETNDIIAKTLRGVFDQYFTGYKSSFNLFIIKGPETNEEFFIHQDPSYIDELKYSPLHVWIPLDDITADNGALCFVPRSHQFFSPYRNISFDPPFEHIRPFVRQYMQPVYVQAGEMLVFDPRLLHNSLPNKTGEKRVVILCGLFPKEAEIVSCYKDVEVENSPIELFRQSEDFFTTYPDFFETCRMRPTVGERIGTKTYDQGFISELQFADLCARYGVKPVNFLKTEEVASCRMFGEPVTL
jgi:hypothetical protein